MKITKQTISNVYIPALLFIVAFCSKLFFINSRDICLDEPFTIFHAQFSVWDILRLPSQNEPNPPFFMLLLHFWIKLFGISPISVRILPLLFNAFTVVFIYLTGKKFFNLWAGILASSIFIFSTYHFYFGLETRTYSLLSMATAASLFYFLSLIKNPVNKKILAILLIANLILIYSHYFGWFIVLVQFLTSFLYFNNKPIFKSLFLVIVLTGILFLPMTPIFIKQFFLSSKGTWVQPPPHSEYMNQLWLFLNSKLVFNITVIILLAGIIYAILTNGLKKINKEIIIIFLWWFIPFTIMFFVSFKVPMFINRYILFNTIALYLFIAIIINYLYTQKLTYVVGVLFIVVFLTQLQINSKDFYYREVKNLANKAKSETTDNSVILIYPYWSDLGFMYYFERDIFENYKKYDSLLLSRNIHHVWNIEGAKEKIKMFQNKRIIYVQDGQLGDYKIYDYLDSAFLKTDSLFYPQCFHIAVFEAK